MRCLVTGAAGFIGSHLVERLIQQGHTVIGIDAFVDYYGRRLKEQNLVVAGAAPSFRLVEGDLLGIDLRGLLREGDCVFHLAAQAGVRGSWGRNFSDYVHHNVLATQHLLEVCKEVPVAKFVFASSSSVYGDNPHAPLREDLVPQPVSPYGVTKLAAEHLCHLYGVSYGVPVVMLRYFTVFGPRQRPDMAFQRFMLALARGEELTVYGDGQQTRDFTYVSDVVEANLLAMASSLTGEVYNIGGGCQTSVAEVVRCLVRVTGKAGRVAYQPVQRGDVRHTLADLSKAKGELGYVPRVDLETGLVQQWEWLKGGYGDGCR